MTKRTFKAPFKGEGGRRRRKPHEDALEESNEEGRSFVVQRFEKANEIKDHEQTVRLAPNGRKTRNKKLGLRELVL